MIAKHVAMRSLGKSDFADLAKYITDAQSKDHRLGLVAVTNCEAFSVRDAITEVLATQHTNTRAQGDKTYHLIVSFRAGENPDDDTLKAIEARICEGLGFGEHQRISAVHHDTDNLHIHIAINKIHPTRHTMHEPYYPHLALGELCTKLEQEYGLERDNHEPRQRGAASRAADMERHAGVESLVGWIKRECLAEIKGAQTWQELHQVMRDNGLEITPRGNGLVIRAEDGTTVKPSTLGRDLSKPALEKRLGTFEPSPERQAEPKRRYKKDPIRLRVNTVELYARYKADQQNLTASRAKALDVARQRKDRKVAAAKASGSMRRAAIKHMTQGRLTKKLLYSQASKALRDEIQTINKQYLAERQGCYEQHSRRTWADWLKQEATQGNGEALAALRAREAAQGLKGNTVQGEGQAKPGHTPVVDTITKKGTIIFRAGKTAVRDDGERLQVSREASREGLQEALRLAMERYGNRITVNGTTEFKAQIIRAAVDSQLPITFADPVLEVRRQALIGGSDTPAKPTIKKPGVGPVGHVPPAARQGRLRTLSQIEALHIEGASIPTPKPAPIPAINDQERRKAKLQAELNAKKEKAKQRKGRGR